MTAVDEGADRLARQIAIRLFVAERHMRQFSFTGSALGSMLRSAVGAVLTFLSPSWDGPARKYRPEEHYMRGPGPKWREKHFRDCAPAGGA
jgi:hypothetical protein